MNILLTLDGILSSESGEPIRTGVQLYYALNEANRVVIITNRNKDDADHLLKSHGIIGYDDLVGSEVHLEGEELRKRQIILCRSRAPLGLYVDSDPTICAWVFEQQQVPILLLANPSYLPVENRPDAPTKVRKWSDIEAAIDKANVAKSKLAIKPKEAELWQD